MNRFQTLANSWPPLIQLYVCVRACVCVCVYAMCFLAVPEPHYYLRERVALYGEEKQLRVCRVCLSACVCMSVCELEEQKCR